MAGRPPKPIALHQRDGTFQPVRHAERERREPKPEAAEVKVPTWAKLDAEGRGMWRRLAPMLAELRVLTEADVVALVQVCRRYGDYMRNRAVVLEYGDTFAEKRYKEGEVISATVKKRPEAQMMESAWADFQRGLGEFGLTPVSRAKVATAPREEGKDAFESLMGRRSG